MSSNDLVEHDDGSVTLPGAKPRGGEWHIHEDDGVWVADHPVWGRLRTDRSAPFAARFRTRDEAVAAVRAATGVPA